MADGYARVLQKPGMCIAQNGPGVTNFVTGVAAAYWANSPILVVTPETGTMTKGMGGFQVSILKKKFLRAYCYFYHFNAGNRSDAFIF